MRYSNLHTHTIFSDGTCMPEEMILAAIEKNMLSIGFSDHSPMENTIFYYMRDSAVPAYCREIRRLAEKYKGQIEIALGMELDWLTEGIDRSQLDYIIGDCHDVITCDGPQSIDHCTEVQQRTLREYFGMDSIAYAKAYFRTYAEAMRSMKPDILGHFDLPCKFGLMDESNPAYLSAAREALAAVLEVTPAIELNTGAISRGYRTIPYPAPYLLNDVRQLGGKFILSSDCHAAENVIFAFEEARGLLISHGFDSMLVWKDGALQEVGLS